MDKILIHIITKENIEQYNVRELVDNGWVSIEILKGVYRVK